MPPYISTEAVGDSGEPHPALLTWFLTKAVVKGCSGVDHWVLLAGSQPRVAGHVLAWVPAPLLVLHCYTGKDPVDDVVAMQQSTLIDPLPARHTFAIMDREVDDISQGNRTWI